MTSSLKLGIAGLAVIGVGLGAYLVNLGLKGDQAEKAPESVQLASSESEQAPATPATEEPRPAPAMEAVSAPPVPEMPVASTDHQTGQAASPAPLGVHESRESTERTWRPRPLETSVAQPAIPAPPPAVDVADLARTEEPAPSDPGDSPAPAAHTPVSSVADSGQMSLQEQPTATQPAQTEQAAAKLARTAPERMIIHVVRPGDTFSALAVKYLGSHRHVKLIEKANPKINPNRLYVGTKLKIPAAPEASKAAADAQTTGTTEPKARPAKAPPVDPAKAYTVKPGDSWSGLAVRYLGDPNWTVLYEYNKERFPPNVRMLQPGMVIEIPTREELERFK